MQLHRNVIKDMFLYIKGNQELTAKAQHFFLSFHIIDSHSKSHANITVLCTLTSPHRHSYKYYATLSLKTTHIHGQLNFSISYRMSSSCDFSLSPFFLRYRTIPIVWYYNELPTASAVGLHGIVIY